MTRFKKIARNLLTVLLLLGAVAFAELRRPQRVCQRLVVEVQTDGARFITPEDVRLLVTQQQTTPLERVKLKDIDLKMLERNVASNSYVQQVNAYHDLAGHRGGASAPEPPHRPNSGTGQRVCRMPTWEPTVVCCPCQIA